MSIPSHSVLIHRKTSRNALKTGQKTTRNRKMEFSTGFQGNEKEIIDLIGATFSASEGLDEGKLVGGLASDLLFETAPDDLVVCTANEAGNIIGCIMFSRMTFAEDDRTVFLMAPVAVSPSHQGKGVGQRLVRFGLEHLARSGADVAITYGDPDYYSKVGFRQIDESVAQAPARLQFPHGWLAQPLSGTDLTPLKGSSRCVGALDNPAYW